MQACTPPGTHHLTQPCVHAGVLSQSQVLLAFGVVADLFNGVRDSPQETLAGGVT